MESVAIDPQSVYEDVLVIKSGIAPGTKIVSEGVGKLRAGMKVRDMGATAPTSPAKPATPAPAASTGGKG